MQEIFDSVQQIIDRKTELEKAGYYSVPISEPLKGLIGFVMYVTNVDSTEDVKNIGYYIYGKPLDCVVERVDAEQLMEFVESVQPNQDIVPCDDPMNLLIGFMVYDPQTEQTICKRCNIGRIKTLPKEKREQLMSIGHEKREQLMSMIK